MRVLRFFKAQATADMVESLELHFSEEFPYSRSHPANLTETLEGTQKLFVREGADLAKALHDVLPGGTFDQLLAEMLRIKASHLVVKFS